MLFLFATLLTIIFFLIYRFEETVVVLAPMSVFLSMFVVPYTSMETVSFLDLIVCFVVVLFVLKGGVKKVIKNPFLICAIVVAISYFCSNKFGCEKHWMMSITKLITSYVYPLVIWNCLNEKNKFDLYIKSMIVFAIVLVAYALFELVTNSNPIIEAGLRSNIFMNNVTLGDNIRFGVRRLQSFLHLYGAFGYTCSSIFLILLYLKIHYPSKINIPDLFLYGLLGLLIVSILCTGTRSVYLSYVVGLGIFYKKLKKYFTVVLILLPVVMLLFSMSSFIMDIAGSFSDTQNVEGSNSEMRGEQLAVTLYYWLQNPIFGNGPTFTFTTVQVVDPTILGAESIWFVLLIDYGLVGCLAFLVTLLIPIRYLIKCGMPQFVFIVLMFLVNKTFSSVPGIFEGYFFIYLVFLIRLEQYRKSVFVKKLSLLKSNGL